MSETFEFHYLMTDRDQIRFLNRRERFAEEAMEIGEFMERLNVRHFECEVLTYGVMKFTFNHVAAAIAFKMQYHDNLITAEEAQQYAGARRMP
jgi:hypothetical protein